MKIVLDTNVLIAAFVSHGLCHNLLEHCCLQHTVITSDFILNEFREKLVTKFIHSADLANQARMLLRSRLTRVVPAVLPSQVCRDADDDFVIGTAVAGMCEFIVTGDKDLLVIGVYDAIRIVSPRDFVDAEITADLTESNLR